MLTIYLDSGRGMLPKGIYSESVIGDYFDACCELDWFRDEFVKHIIKEIDNSDVLSIDAENGVSIYNSKHNINIPTSLLTINCKTLILLYSSDCTLNCNHLSNDCFGVLSEIYSKKDIVISLSHIIPIYGDFKIQNTGEVMGDLELLKMRFDDIDSLPSRNGDAWYEKTNN